MKQGLILVDLQNDYFTGGSMELVGMEGAADNAQKLLTHFRRVGSPVLHIQHVANRPGATFFLPNTNGVEIHESVSPQSDEIVVEKHFPNSFRETALLDHLTNSGIDELVICGAMSHMCIDATTRAAFDLGFRCIVIEDACATCDLRHRGTIIRAAEVHGAFMAALVVPYARVISTEEFLDA